MPQPRRRTVLPTVREHDGVDFTDGRVNVLADAGDTTTVVVVLCLGTVLMAAFVLFVGSQLATGYRYARGVKPAGPVARPSGATQVCRAADCGCESPAEAKFCRRCGRPTVSLTRRIGRGAGRLRGRGSARTS